MIMLSKLSAFFDALPLKTGTRSLLAVDEAVFTPILVLLVRSALVTRLYSVDFYCCSLGIFLASASYRSYRDVFDLGWKAGREASEDELPILSL